MSKAKPTRKSPRLNKALVIVDVQDYFMDMMECEKGTTQKHYAKMMKGILREIKAFKKARLPIVCLQYTVEDGFDSPRASWCYQATDSKIRKALRGYPRAFYAWKDEDNGAEEVLDVLEGKEPRMGMDSNVYNGKKNMPRKMPMTKGIVDFTVVGVNATACVAATCSGLIDNGHICRIPADAAMDVWDCTFADEHADDELDFDGIRVTNCTLAKAA